jgi:hypothetical protein
MKHLEPNPLSIWGRPVEKSPKLWERVLLFFRPGYLYWEPAKEEDIGQWGLIYKEWCGRFYLVQHIWRRRHGK